ncbi:MAG: DNA oxidative demethylase AlkB [Rhodanobacter sp.]
MHTADNPLDPNAIFADPHIMVPADDAAQTPPAPHTMFSADLFGDPAEPIDGNQRLGDGAILLRGFALADESALLEALDGVLAHAPWRHMITPGGKRMSVAMTNAGRLGWISDQRSYRYVSTDPLSGQAWPAMPPVFLRLAACAAAQAGFTDFEPDACLINRYTARTRLSLHQDRDEQDFSQPIVSVSLGIPAVFLFGGEQRTDRPRRVPLVHGDVVVWGGPGRLRYHGVLPVKPDHHAVLGDCRINLTLRRAG